MLNLKTSKSLMVITTLVVLQQRIVKEYTVILIAHRLSTIVNADKIIVLGLNPNTIVGSQKVNLPERTPKLLSDPLFFKNVAETRKILEKGFMDQN